MLHRLKRVMAGLRLPHSLLAAGLIAVIPLGLALAQQSVTYTYDELGRVRTATYADGKQIIYNYDAAGNRTSQVVSTITSNRPPVAVDDNRSTNEATPQMRRPHIVLIHAAMTVIPTAIRSPSRMCLPDNSAPP